MTPQILLDALRKAFLSLEMVSLIILDECHRASGNHPYTRIMKVNNLFLATNFVAALFHLFCGHISSYFSIKYCCLMKEYYHKLNNKPKVFGMTASPVLRKGKNFWQWYDQFGRDDLIEPCLYNNQNGSKLCNYFILFLIVN